MRKNGSNRRFLYAWAGAFTLALGGASWSTPASAAAHAVAGCDKTVQDLRNLDAGQLRLEAVDLSDVSGSPESPDNLSESVAPLLFLTPRVASILQEVFGDSDAVSGAESTSVTGTGSESPSSPVVDNTNAPERTEGLASPMYEHAAILPRFQRQMYRTDI